MTKAREMADLLDANGDVKAASLDNVPPSDWSTVANKPTLALADGTGATGSWPIAITGNAATATTATTATSANAVAWANVSGIPATATSFPTWSEVTGKPTIPSNCSNCDNGVYNCATPTWGNCSGANNCTNSRTIRYNMSKSGTNIGLSVSNCNCNCQCRD